MASVSIRKRDSIEGVRALKEATRGMNHASVYRRGGGERRGRASGICDIALGGSRSETGCERKGSV